MRALLPEPFPELDDRRLLVQYAWPDRPAGETAPWVRVNFAASVDGAITGIGNRSASVSGTADKRVFALLRATCDAVLVGAGTARIEGYGPVQVHTSMSDLRTAEGRNDPPPLVVVTRSCELDPAAPMFTDATVRTVVVTCDAAPADWRAGLADVADVISCGDQAVDMRVMADVLGDRGYPRVLCEGGPHLFADLLAAERIDDVCLTTSPLIVGPLLPAEDGTLHDPGRMCAGTGSLDAATKLSLVSLVEAQGSLLGLWRVTGSNNRGHPQHRRGVPAIAQVPG